MLACGLHVSAAADELDLPTDLDIITAVDASDSITRHDEWLQYAGLARAVTHTDFLSEVANGHNGRVGFTLFTWSSHGDVRVVVPWTAIASAEDAARVAQLIKSAPRIDRSSYESGPHGDADDDPPAADAYTDIALAISHATDIARARNRRGRTVVNVLSDGTDNSGASPDVARDAALRAGLTISGVVFGARPEVPLHFQHHVIGGAGAFLIEVAAPEDLIEALQRKFWHDLVSLRYPAPGVRRTERGE